MSYKDFKEIVFGSKEFTFDGSILELTGYFTGKKVLLDLGNIDEEMFEKLVVDDDDDEDW